MLTPVSLRPDPPQPPQTVPLRPRDLRLRRHADFQVVYQHARKQYAKELSFFFTLRTGPPAGGRPIPLHLRVPAGPRIGLTVGKVLGKAHDRNRIKRRLREAVRLHANLLAGLDVDVVLHPRRTLLTLEWTRIDREIAQVFRTVRQLAAKPQPTRLSARPSSASPAPPQPTPGPQPAPGPHPPSQNPHRAP